MVNPKLPAIALGLALVVSVVAPGAALAQTASTANTSIGVDTEPATNVTASSATLNGNLTALSGADNATVWFEYWAEGDHANASNTTEITLEAPGEFDTAIDGLDSNTTYVYVANARANGTEAAGNEVTFTTGAGNDTDTRESFGNRVSVFVHGLLDGGIDDDQVFGQLVSQFVLANNPGADNRPDHAGPPWLDNDGDDDGNESDHDADDDRGPPEHAGPKDGDDEDEQEDDEEDEEDEETEDESEADDDEEDEEDDDEEDQEDEEDEDEDDDRGPPEHAGPPDGDDDEDDA